MFYEKWNEIPGYEGRYMVSNTGQVIIMKRKGRNEERILKPQRDTWGYGKVHRCDGNGQVKTHHLHRLTAEAFLPSVPGKPLINHKNGVKKDNHIFNLEWCTSKENIRHAVKTGLNGARKFPLQLTLNL